MAGLVNGSALNSPKTVEGLVFSDFCVDLRSFTQGSIEGDQKDYVKCLFDEIVSAFLSDNDCGNKCFRPFPPVLGNGQSVDLLKLYLVVKEKGGYEDVSDNGLWDCVAKEFGLSFRFGSSLKLIYAKYLDSIDEWMQRTVNVKDLKGKLGDSEAVQSADMMDFEAETNCILSENSRQKVKDGDQVHVDLEESKLDLISGEKSCEDVKICNSLDFDEWKENGTDMVFKSGVVYDDDLEKNNCQNTEDRMSEQLNGNEDRRFVLVNGHEDWRFVLVNGHEDRRFVLVNGHEDRRFVLVNENNGSENDKKIGDAETLDSTFDSQGDEDTCNRKRKRACNLELLNWVTKVARDPCNPVIGCLPDVSKWKYIGDEQLWKQVLVFRQAMMVKRHAGSSALRSIWQKQKMHPAMYEEHSGSSRHLHRISSAKISRAVLNCKRFKARLCAESTSSGNQSDLEDTFGRQSSRLTDSLSGLWLKNFSRKRIPLGASFQAEVPVWTGKSDESDSKWLGTRVWPLEKTEKSNSLVERDRTGFGRHEQCGCEFEGSFECIKFHVSQKRNRLKMELGMAFYRWDIDMMGEEAAFFWNKAEETKFEDIIKSNPPSQGNSFWEEIHNSFLDKKREQLVSYYFNVFLLRRRGLQNRSTPIEISSDDDDLEFESLTNCNGQMAAKAPKPIYCSPKKTHLNFRG